MIRFFASHPTAANLLMVIFLVGGALSLRTLRRETFPDFSADEVEVRVLFPGATAEEVEEVICQRVEDAIDGVRFIHEVRSEARAGIGIIVAEMGAGGNIITFKDDVNTAIAAIDDFPPDVEEPVVSQLNTVDPVLTVLVSGPMPTPDLKQYCEIVKRRLQTLPDVALVEVQGFSDRQLRIALSSEALRRHRVSVADVADIVARQNIDLPAGVLETAERDIVIRFQDQRNTVQELEDLVVRGSAGGAELTIRDLGTVTETFEFAEEKTLLDGCRAGVLAIQKTKNQDALRVADQVKAFVERLRHEQPNVAFAISQDTSTLVRDRLQLLVTNGAQGMVLVFVTMWLFFNVRLSFWVVMSLPVSFLGAAVLMPQLDLTINMLTMVGLLLAIGILMDDGIVIAENVAAHRARGAAPLEAAVAGTREVAGGVVSSFVTTVCVLGPLAGLAGDIGKVLRVVPIVLILVLIISLIEAFVILPAHLVHAMRAEHEPSRVRRAIDGMLEAIRERVVGRLVDWAIAWRYAWLGSVVLLFLAVVSLVAGGVIKFQAFPELDGDVIVSRVLMPPGTPLEQTERVVGQVTAGLERVNARFQPEQPDGHDLVHHHYVTFNQNADAYETGPHVATITVDLLSAEQRNGRLDDILAAWAEAVGPVTDAVAVSYTEPTLGPSGRNIEVRLHGTDLQQLQDAGQRLHRWVGDFVGVKNLTLDARRGQPEYRIRLREGAFGIGLDANAVARQLRAAFHGVTADEIQVGTESYEIDVQLAPDDQNSDADLDYFHVRLPGGQAIPLGTIAEIEEARGWSRIARTDGVRTVTLRGDTDTARTNTAQVLARVRDEFVPTLRAEFPDIRVDFEGEAREVETTQASMLSGAALGLLGVFALLSLQFRSYIEPLIVMTIIPLSLIGVILGHALFGLDLSMPSMLGVVSLAGIVVNDSILLTLFLRAERARGTAAVQAAATASRQRFRAVILTSLTTVAGLLPLTLERSLQAQVLIPLAVSIAAGLMATTCLVLLVIPSLYVVLDDLGLTARIGATDLEAHT